MAIDPETACEPRTGRPPALTAVPYTDNVASGAAYACAAPPPAAQEFLAALQQITAAIDSEGSKEVPTSQAEDPDAKFDPSVLESALSDLARINRSPPQTRYTKAHDELFAHSDPIGSPVQKRATLGRAESPSKRRRDVSGQAIGITPLPETLQNLRISSDEWQRLGSAAIERQGLRRERIQRRAASPRQVSVTQRAAHGQQTARAPRLYPPSHSRHEDEGGHKIRVPPVSQLRAPVASTPSRPSGSRPISAHTTSDSIFPQKSAQATSRQQLTGGKLPFLKPQGPRLQPALTTSGQDVHEHAERGVPERKPTAMHPSARYTSGMPLSTSSGPSHSRTVPTQTPFDSNSVRASQLESSSRRGPQSTHLRERRGHTVDHTKMQHPPLVPPFLQDPVVTPSRVKPTADRSFVRAQQPPPPLEVVNPRRPPPRSTSHRSVADQRRAISDAYADLPSYARPTESALRKSKSFQPNGSSLSSIIHKR